MPVRVVDASALGALVFGEPKAEEIAEALAEAQIAAPALLWYELANLCLGKIKAHPTQRDQILGAFELTRRLTIQIVEVDHPAIVELAEQTGLTTYDTSYPWLARHLDGELITLDKRMRKAMGR